jgi:tetraacyldisaccharide 4'-kinase
MSVLLICAIARTDYLVDYLNEKVANVRVLEYEDHHFYSKYEIANLQQTFEKWEADKKVILTTEKDAMRLELHFPFMTENKMPVFALPVRVKFHFDEGEQFDETVKEYLLGFRE